jgi:hypothetical protein
MRHFGYSVGLRLRVGIQKEGGDALAINHLLEEVNEAGHQKGRVVELSSGRVVKEITECPFSGSPPEIGEQLECFANGICEVIDDGFEVTHPKAMCRGDTSCIRVIARKAPSPGTSKKGEGRGDKPEAHNHLEVLKSRLAKGEISLEEYRLLKEELSG